MRFLLSLMLMSSFVAGQANAQTSTSTLETTSKLSMDVDAYSEADNEFSSDNLLMWADLNAYYELSENNRLTLRNTFAYRTASTANKFDYDGVELHFRRKNILTEEEHGVAVKADLRMVYSVNADNRNSYGSYGDIHGRVYFKKTLTPNLTANALLRYYRLLNNKSSTDESFNSRYRAGAWIDYSFNDTWAANTSIDVSDRLCKNSHNDEVYLQLEQGIKYSFSGSTYLKTYANIRPLQSFDSQGWRNETLKEATFGLNFNTTLF